MTWVLLLMAGALLGVLWEVVKIKARLNSIEANKKIVLALINQIQQTVEEEHAE